MNHLISIIVPVYNAQKTLDRCIDSLKKQTYKNIEIILINDGSTDSSLLICEKHKTEDNRIIVIDKENGGVSSARNAGLEKANGSFIMFCDSDDWVEPYWCKYLIEHVQNDNFVMCGCYIEGKQSYLPYEIKADNGNTIIKREKYYTLKLSNFNVLWNKIFDRTVIQENNIHFNENLTNGEDYLFVLQYLDSICGNILFIDKCLYHYKWPSGQTLSNKVTENYLKQCCFLSKEILMMAKKIGVSDEEGICQIKTDFFNEFQKLIITILHNENLSFWRKIQNIKSVMNTEEYKNCVKSANISPNKLYSLLYRCGSSLGIWFWHSVRN